MKRIFTSWLDVLLVFIPISMVLAVSHADPLSVLGVAVLLSVVAVAACLIPASRATKVDPMDALRYD